MKPTTCPLNNLPVFPATRLPNGSVFSIAESGYGIQIAYADEEMDATAATPATANLLKLARNEPLIRIRQVIYSTKGKATLYVLGLYRSDRTTY
ncbi:MAG TPA: UTRA domain-containing protein [Candidatus Acidoferrum sp.]|nr:UTRA domain-containing protein [Candidatus Acidoferrum sp.]